jgi:crotonobetainyl-CoA:carnitine CoA-transferase CaiB-like acyl-CoA transferase
MMIALPGRPPAVTILGVSEALRGVRVLEVAMYVFGPAAGAVLADWGADVVKVEPLGSGDPVRTNPAWGYPGTTDGISYIWEAANRGKRAIAIDLSVPEGRELVLTLVEDCDVFLTNYLPGVRRKLGIDVDDVMGRNPNIIYARASAVGPQGPESENGGFDGITFWARSGAAASVTPPGSPFALPMPGPGFGDSQTGMTLAGGVAAALYKREKTGKGVVVDTSLLGQGLWAMALSLAGTSLNRTAELPRQEHSDAPNPAVNQYRTSDGRFIALALLQSDKYWAGFCEVVGHEDWATDERFSDATRRFANRGACITMLDELFAGKTLAEWRDILAKQDGQWDVVRIPGEVAEDEQATANGYVQSVEYPNGRTVQLVPAPVQFDQDVVSLAAAPGHGEHTDEVLTKAGLTATRIAELRKNGVIA